VQDPRFHKPWVTDSNPPTFVINFNALSFVQLTDQVGMRTAKENHVVRNNFATPRTA
jgi:ABC-type Fe2+-enterobactin transport system substrate-binding protein